MKFLNINLRLFILIVNLFTMHAYGIITGIQQNASAEYQSASYEGNVLHIGDLINNFDKSHRVLSKNRRINLVIRNNTGINYEAEILHTYNDNTTTSSCFLSKSGADMILVDEFFPYAITIKHLKAQHYDFEKKYVQPLVTIGYVRENNGSSDLAKLTTFFSSPIQEYTNLTCVIDKALFNKYANTGSINLTLSVEKGNFVLQGCE